MVVDLPSDLSARIQSFIAFDGYATELDVIRDALAALKQQTDLTAIREGVAEAEAGRLRPWAEVKEEVR